MTTVIIGIELVVIWFLRRFFAGHFILWMIRLIRSRRGAVWIYSVLTLPGLLVHEIAHFLMAALLGLRTGTIELLPVLSDSGGIEFGSVQVEKADPIRLSMVGLAPLIAGLPLVAWMSLKMPENYWVWGYLIVCVTTHLLPSKQDMRYWPVTVAVVGLLWWLGFQINNVYLWQSVMKGLLIPMGVLAGGTVLFFIINLLFGRRKIVQW